MSARARFTPQAELDLLDQAVYLAESASLEMSDRLLRRRWPDGDSRTPDIPLKTGEFSGPTLS
jgi:hypothetical protein